MKEKIEMLNKLIKSAEKIVFFGGAGVSTESGLPDFRGTGGLYQTNDAYPPEEILSTIFLYPYRGVLPFYRKKMAIDTVAPNITHCKLAELETAGKLLAVVTQNIDGLHQAAGSKTVYELHGSIHRNHCLSCGHSYSLREILAQAGVPLLLRRRDQAGCGALRRKSAGKYVGRGDSRNFPGRSAHRRGARLFPSTLPPGLCVTMAEESLCSSIKRLPLWMGKPACFFLCGLGEVFGRIEI